MHLFIEMPHDAVDVNVHPTKAEVRFRDQSYIHELVRRTLGDALGRGPAPELQLEAPRGLTPESSTLPLPHAYTSVFPSRWSNTPQTPATTFPPLPVQERPIAPVDVSVSEPLIRPLMPLGQFRDTFIVAVDDEGIAIIDQHVAHERVLFERITERLTAGRLESQRLLEPMILELPPSSRHALTSRAAELERLGFEIEEFGGETVRVSAFPALLRREECPTALRALAEDLETAGNTATVDEAIKKIAATMACHAAVKANDPLTPEKMAHILDELRRTSYSTICPHGRPVMLRLTRREVEKNFQRI
jgi:DNA mismatch repair protein MutL